MSKRVLVVEDDTALARVLRDNLTIEGFDVRCVTDGDLAIDAATEFGPDLVLLDVMLPGKSGFEICSALRQTRRSNVIMLTARDQKVDRLRGLYLGADDYVAKPFDLEELLARVHAVLRRRQPGVERLTLGTVTIDFEALKAWNADRALELTHREFEVLRYLAQRRGSVVRRDELLREVWHYSDMVFTRSVDNAIARLRRKIEVDARRPQFIRTVHGDGYCLAPRGSGESDQ
jgi:two-component system response regulator VicR